MSANYALNTKNNFKINAATSYRLPTFNDLYWKESSAVGNPNLLPESGKNIDVGYVFRDNKRQFHANFFVIDIKNNIVWLPNNQNIFMPRNLLRTLSTGTELKASYALKINKTNLKYTLQYHYTNATDASTKKQLIYTPKHQATTQLQGNYKQMHAQYSHQWVGARYTTSDNENTVKKHSIASLSINYTQKMATKCSINAQVEINNLYNTRYQILAYRIMPPRSLLASLTLNFN
jgi:iron complex outermembrane receptor protein